MADQTPPDRAAQIVEQWRSIKGVERSTDDELWKRFSKARSEFNRKRQAHFDELDRNRERAFARSIDTDGNVWLEYVGFYPTLAEMPQETFDTLFGGVLMHFQDDYAALEGFVPQDGMQIQQPQA